jgi:hypothetical protein
VKLRSVFATENSRVRAIYLLRLESLIILGLVIYLLVAPLISEVNAPAASVGLWVSASGFKQKKSFGRAPAVLANLIALGVSYYMITGKLLIVGIPLAILAAITLISSALGYRE